jgi:hypothetical protein
VAVVAAKPLRGSAALLVLREPLAAAVGAFSNPSRKGSGSIPTALPIYDCPIPLCIVPQSIAINPPCYSAGHHHHQPPHIANRESEHGNVRLSGPKAQTSEYRT